MEHGPHVGLILIESTYCQMEHVKMILLHFNDYSIGDSNVYMTQQVIVVSTDPTPTITGTTGGVSATPTGLTINGYWSNRLRRIYSRNLYGAVYHINKYLC